MPPGAPAAIVVDLFGPGYDNPAQERTFATQPGQTSVHWSDTMDVGHDVPDVVSLRIFYDGPPGLLLSDIRVVEVPTWRIWVGHLLMALLLAAAVALIAAVADWTRKDDAVAAAYIPWSLLVALWLSAALIRYVAAQLLPYWSGDEYVYKMIASGIWAGGGRSGIPLPDQIQHATNLPNMLYPYLIAPSFMIGDSFYTGVRLINALIVASGLFPTYLMARRFLNGRLSLVIAVAAIALPGSSSPPTRSPRCCTSPLPLGLLGGRALPGTFRLDHRADCLRCLDRLDAQRAPQRHHRIDGGVDDVGTRCAA